MNFFSNFFAVIDLQTDTYVNAQVAIVAAYASPFVLSASIILIIGVDLAIMFGKIDAPFRDIMIALVTIALVTNFATNVGVYNLYFKTLLLGLPDDLVNLAGAPGVGEALDNFGDSILEAVIKVWRTSTGIVGGLKAAVIAGILFIVWALMSAAAVVALLVAKVGLAVLVAVGPLFIGLAIHPITREYFTKWLSYCTNFAFLAMLVGGVLAFISSVADNYFLTLSETDGGVDFVELAAPTIIMIVLIKMFDQLPNISSSLGGGIALSGSNLAGRGLDRATEPLKRATKKITGAESREIKRNAKVHDKTQTARKEIVRKRTAANKNK